MADNKKKGSNIFDLDNLRKAMQLLDTMSDTMNRYLDVSNKVNEQNQKANGKTLESYVELRKAIIDLNKQLKDLGHDSGVKTEGPWTISNEDIRKVQTYAESIDKQRASIEDKARKQAMYNREVERQYNIITQGDKQQEDRQKRIEEIKKRINELDKQASKDIKSAEKDFKSQGKHTKKQTNSFNEQVTTAKQQISVDIDKAKDLLNNDNISVSDAESILEGVESNYDDVMKGLSTNVGKIGTAASVWSVATDTFKQAVNTAKELFTQGVNNQTNAYESTFSDIAARTGVSRGAYYNAQNRLGGMGENLLGEMGLFHSVRASDVQLMWEELASQGINIADEQGNIREDATVNAINAVVDKTLIPYINTSSKFFQQMQEHNPNLLKQIRGIGTATTEISGNSIVANEYLQDMIQNTGPLAQLANQELGLQYAKTTGMYEYLREHGGKDGKGMSDYEISQYMGATYQMYNDPLAALKSGDLDLQVAVTNAIAGGGDLKDWGYSSEHFLRAGNFVSNITPEGNLSPLYAGMTNTALSTMAKTLTNENNYDIEGAIAAGEETQRIAEEKGEEQENNFARGYMQTNSELQEITMENIATEFSTLKQFLGNWYGILETAIKGIGAAIAATVVGKGIGALAGTIGGGSGAGLLAAAGGVAIGAASIAAIAKATSDAYKAGTSEEAMAEAHWSPEEKEDKGWLSNIGHGISTSMANLGGMIQAEWGEFTDNDATIAKGKHSAISAIISSSFGNESDYEANLGRLAELMLMDKGGMIKHLEGVKETHEDLVERYNALPDSDKAFVKQFATNIQSSVKDIQITDTDGHKVDVNSIDWNNYHRVGLDKVPYDNYPALLHEDETVLTASSANELRNLLTEYRNSHAQVQTLQSTVNNYGDLTKSYQQTTLQNASFDAIIQNQTTALINKMEELKTAIINKNELTPELRNKTDVISSSMKNMRSTKSFV